MKKIIIAIAILNSVSSFADDFRPMNCVRKVMEMKSQMKPGKAIPSNDFYRNANARAQAEYKFNSEIESKFEEIYYINSNSNAVIAICDDETGYEQGDCYQYYFNKKGNQLNLLATTVIPHIGKDKINFLCEGE